MEIYHIKAHIVNHQIIFVLPIRGCAFQREGMKEKGDSFAFSGDQYTCVELSV